APTFWKVQFEAKSWATRPTRSSLPSWSRRLISELEISDRSRRSLATENWQLTTGELTIITGGPPPLAISQIGRELVPVISSFRDETRRVPGFTIQSSSPSSLQQGRPDSKFKCVRKLSNERR